MLGPFFLYVEQVNKYLGSSFSGNSKKSLEAVTCLYFPYIEIDCTCPCGNLIPSCHVRQVGGEV